MRRLSAKTLTTLLVISVALSLTSFALAASSGDFSFETLSDGSVRITKYTGSASSVAIPEAIDGKIVTTIGERAFRYARISNITIPRSVNSIGLKAFLGCENLRTVVFQESEGSLEIGDYAFDGNTALVTVDIGAKGINLNERAFRYCSTLQSVIFTNSPNALNVGEKAFLGCTGLLSFDVPDTVSSLHIGGYSFDSATALQNVHLSGETIRMDERAFRYCESIKEVTFAENVRTIQIDDKAFLGCSGLVNFLVPETVTDFSAGAYAFDGGTSLSALTLGSGNIYLGERAFRYCESLTKLLIPNGSVSIGEKTFLGCSRLTLYGASGNIAEQYAKANRIAFADASSYSPIPAETFDTAPPLTIEVVQASETIPPATALSSQNWTCPNCGNAASGNFCSNCGNARPVDAVPTETLIVTTTIAPTPVPTVSIQHATATPWEEKARQLSNGSYTVGVDIPAGTYHFWKINGDRYTAVLYVFNADNLEDKVASGSADEIGCVLNLKEGQILKLTWTGAYASKFNSAWDEGEEKMLPSGSYTVGEDIPAGTYHFWKMDGDRYTSVVYVFNADNLKDERASGSADEIGCVLNLKEGQILKLTWTGVYAGKFNPAWDEGEEKMLPSGSYVVDEDIPAGRYTFKKIDGDKYTAVVYVYNATDLENKVDSGSANQRGYVVTLKEGQILRITWTGVKATVENMSPINVSSVSARTIVFPTDDLAPKPAETPATSIKELVSVPTKAPQPSTGETEKVKLSSGREIVIRKSVKEALDAYEAYMDGYKDAMTKINDGDFNGYMTFMVQYEEFIEKVGDLEDDLTDEESLYYLDVSIRVLQKMY